MAGCVRTSCKDVHAQALAVLVMRQYGELVALANMQQALGDEAESAATAAEAEVLRGSLLQRLWHPEVAFLGTYKTEPPPAWSAPYSAEGIIIETRCLSARDCTAGTCLDFAVGVPGMLVVPAHGLAPASGSGCWCHLSAAHDVRMLIEDVEL